MIVFVSDTFHHHQKGVADSLYELTRGSYRFITTRPLREERKRMGFGVDYPEYVIDASQRTKEVWSKAQEIINGADVVVLGSAPYALLKKRLSEKKLTFRYSEHLWKQYKHYLKTPFYIWDNVKTKWCYMLCASAFASKDYNRIGSFIGKCYKWGYFPEINPIVRNSEGIQKAHVRMMWCSRFLDWKHPELPIYLAKYLKDRGYSFSIDMFGSGQYLKKSKQLVNELGIEDVVYFCGNVSNAQVLERMRDHDIFLFTSDRGEGWGVVSNEAMSSGCVLVASDEIGSVPYLVQDGENGCTFHSSSRLFGFGALGVTVDKKALNSLVEKVERLINNPNERERLSANAVKTIHDTWNPKVAAYNFLKLIDDINQGRDISIVSGPCSKA